MRISWLGLAAVMLAGTAQGADAAWSSMMGGSGSTLVVSQPQPDGGTTMFNVFCQANTPGFYVVALDRPKGALTAAQAEAARASVRGLMFMPGDGGPTNIIAADAVTGGEVRLDGDDLVIFVTVPREAMRRFAAAGPGASVRVNAGEAWGASLGGHEHQFPVKGLADTGLTFVDRNCHGR